MNKNFGYLTIKLKNGKTVLTGYNDDVKGVYKANSPQRG
jgi:hypothetical protein